MPYKKFSINDYNRKAKEQSSFIISTLIKELIKYFEIKEVDSWIISDKAMKEIKNYEDAVKFGYNLAVNETNYKIKQLKKTIK